MVGLGNLDGVSDEEKQASSNRQPTIEFLDFIGKQKSWWIGQHNPFDRAMIRSGWVVPVRLAFPVPVDCRMIKFAVREDFIQLQYSAVKHYLG